MTSIKKTGQILLGTLASVAFMGACNRDDRAQARVDEVKDEAKDLKDRAEKRTEHAKESLDRQLDATKASADRRVDEVKRAADHAKDDVRHEVRGNDADLGPDASGWRSHWEHFYATPNAKWNGDDEWVVERGHDGEMRAHRRVYDRSEGTRMDDGAVTAAVKGRFALDNDTRGKDIDIDAHDGVVTLKGTVPTSAVAGEAVRLALGTKGVRTVVSRLSIK